MISHVYVNIYFRDQIILSRGTEYQSSLERSLRASVSILWGSEHGGQTSALPGAVASADDTLDTLSSSTHLQTRWHHFTHAQRQRIQQSCNVILECCAITNVVGDHATLEHAVLRSPDELCWAHVILPRCKILSCFSNLTLHRHLAPLRTDFTDTRTALRFFLCFSFFLVFSYRYFLLF